MAHFQAPSLLPGAAASAADSTAALLIMVLRACSSNKTAFTQLLQIQTPQLTVATAHLRIEVKSIFVVRLYAAEPIRASCCLQGHIAPGAPCCCHTLTTTSS
jgi:hypothetical protein